MKHPSRIIIVGGPKRGKSTLGETLSSRYGLTHLCTDPQRLLPSGANGTPDHLDYGGDNGVGQWVCDHWIGRERALIEGVKAHSALDRHLHSYPVTRSSDVCDLLIVLVERVSGEPDPDKYRRQEQQAETALSYLERMGDRLDNLELWVPDDEGGFQRHPTENKNTEVA